MRAIVTGDAGSTPATGVFNVGTGTERSILALHGLYAETAGGGLRPRFAPERPGVLRHSVLDPSRAGRELGWRATMTVANGLVRPRERNPAALRVPRRRYAGLHQPVVSEFVEATRARMGSLVAVRVPPGLSDCL
jgi:hypothetical protein